MKQKRVTSDQLFELQASIASVYKQALALNQSHVAGPLSNAIGAVKSALKDICAIEAQERWEAEKEQSTRKDIPHSVAIVAETLGRAPKTPLGQDDCG